MPGLSLQTDAFILRKRPPAESFALLTVFSPTEGLLTVLERAARKAAAASAHVDLFDEAALLLESSNQGQTWFLREARVLEHQDAIGRDYEALRHASEFAAIVARNPVSAESREAVADLLRGAFHAFGATGRPDIVRLKSLYRFARDEGYPVAQQWIADLSAADRQQVEPLLGRPVTELETPPAIVERMQASLELYLRVHTEMVLD